MTDSDSFAVLNGDDSEPETEIIEGDWTPDFRKNQERKRLISRILKLCGKDDGKGKPLNVVIIGPHGVGKSAFINTLAAALGGDRWREYAYTGSYGAGGGGMTVYTTSFEKCCKTEQYKDYLLPTLIDIAGFEDQQGEEFIELLRIVFYGRLHDGESLAEAEQYYRAKGLDGLRTKYRGNNEKLKVDRVIVLTSATVLVPENLIHCVVQAARPSGTKANPKKRTIPLFGVMLKFDKVVSKEEYERRKSMGGSLQLDVIEEEEYEKRERKFIHALGLGGSQHRFLRCSNYCDDVDRENRRVDSVIPDLDLPVLRLFTQVADPVMKVHNEGETYDEGGEKPDEEAEHETEVQEADTTQNRKTTDRTRLDQGRQPTLIDSLGENNVSMLLISVEALLVAFILTILLKPPVDMVKLKAVCKYGGSSGIQDICNDLDSTGFMSQIFFILALIALVLLRIGATVLTARLFRQRRNIGNE